MKPEAVIFDLDGTLIDNNSYHIEAWKIFYEKIGKEYSKEEYLKNINGRINKDIFNYIFKTTLTADEIKNYDAEKEAMYRDLYAPHIQPIKGLIHFLEQLQNAAIPMAIATSGQSPNINFMFDNLPLKKYFASVIDATQIANGKPHPEIFLKAAASVHAEPQFCIAFEDSIAGIRSAKDAGMKVIGLATTHAREEISEAHYVINDYSEISLATIEAML